VLLDLYEDMRTTRISAVTMSGNHVAPYCVKHGLKQDIRSMLV